MYVHGRSPSCFGEFAGNFVSYADFGRALLNVGREEKTGVQGYILIILDCRSLHLASVA